MKKCLLTIAMVICGILGISNVMTALVSLFVDFGFAIGTALSAALYLFIAKKLYEKINKTSDNKKEKVTPENNKNKDFQKEMDKLERKEKIEKATAVLGKVLGVIICIALCIGVVVFGFTIINIILGLAIGLIKLIFIGFKYVVGALIGLAVIWCFIGFWWDGVTWNHIYKPRGYVRVKTKRRR